MQFFFYSTPEDLKEVFSEIETLYNIAYQPRLLNLTWKKEIDGPINEPLNSLLDFYDFGRSYPCDGGFLIYRSDDPMLGSYLPAHLKFSGPPYSIADPRLLCEGALFLSPENKNEMDKNLYKVMKRCFTKRFKKIGHGYLSPAAYSNRHEYLFFRSPPAYMSDAWYLDDKDQPVSITIDSWYQARGENVEQYSNKDFNFHFFALEKDFLGIFHELESEYQIKYVPHGQVKPPEKEYDTVDTLLDSKQKQLDCLILYEKRYRLLVHLRIGGYQDETNQVVEASNSWYSPNPFGSTLYTAFVAKVKEHFYTVEISDGRRLYLSPTIYPLRRKVVLSINDERFRINEKDEAVHVWRKEWGELLEQWNLKDD